MRLYPPQADEKNRVARTNLFVRVFGKKKEGHGQAKLVHATHLQSFIQRVRSFYALRAVLFKTGMQRR